MQVELDLNASKSSKPEEKKKNGRDFMVKKPIKALQSL